MVPLQNRFDSLELTKIVVVNPAIMTNFIKGKRMLCSKKVDISYRPNRLAVCHAASSGLINTVSSINQSTHM